jgi:NTE family protein
MDAPSRSVCDVTRCVSEKALVLLVLALLSACAGAAQMNQPLTSLPQGPTRFGTISEGGYRYPNLAPNGQADDLFIALAFSGGGKRSAAFSFGVLDGLRNYAVQIGQKRTTLLRELDSISSVSGGSFTAAYYGLYRDRIFSDYYKDFLNRDLEAYIYGMYLMPWNWKWLVDPYYGTNDYMSRKYAELMFGDATFADLLKNGRPMINITATDMTFGTIFPFNQNQFDLLCSDLSKESVAQAVAASNGFPVLFTPITLTNYASRCGGRRPQWVTEGHAEESRDPLSRRAELARDAEKYLDQERTPYVHLLDGGVSDNLAVRSLLDVLLSYNLDPEKIRKAPVLLRVRRFALVFADGESAADESWAKQRTVTSIAQIFSAVSGTQIDRYNFETLILARQTLRRLVAATKKARCASAKTIDGHPCDDVRGYFIHLSLQDIKDPKVRESLQTIPTGLTIPPDAVDLLVKAGRDAVRASPQIRRLKDEL